MWHIVACGNMSHFMLRAQFWKYLWNFPSQKTEFQDGCSVGCGSG
jgi:hypothetical protein